MLHQALICLSCNNLSASLLGTISPPHNTRSQLSVGSWMSGGGGVNWWNHIQEYGGGEWREQDESRTAGDEQLQIRSLLKGTKIRIQRDFIFIP